MPTTYLLHPPLPLRGKRSIKRYVCVRCRVPLMLATCVWACSTNDAGDANHRQSDTERSMLMYYIYYIYYISRGDI